MLGERAAQVRWLGGARGGEAFGGLRSRATSKTFSDQGSNVQDQLRQKQPVGSFTRKFCELQNVKPSFVFFYVFPAKELAPSLIIASFALISTKQSHSLAWTI